MLVLYGVLHTGPAPRCLRSTSGPAANENCWSILYVLVNLTRACFAGEMMMSLLWYYRPEHTKQGRQKDDMPDELFASKHRDVNSVACIDDRCYVLTFNEYCRSVFYQIMTSRHVLCIIFVSIIFSDHSETHRCVGLEFILLHLFSFQ